MKRFVWKIMRHNLAAGCVLQVVLIAALGGCGRAGSTGEGGGVALSNEAYDLNCAQCHYDGGGDGFSTPPLRGSAVVRGVPGPLIDIVLHGQAGVSLIDGRPGRGIMPAQDYLTDEEIADILTYVRVRFGNNASAITAAEVAKRREESPKP